MKDFYSMTPLDSKLDGNSRKIMLLDNYGIKWMCKFDKMRGNQRMHDSISEHISCTILRFLGYYVQYTEIGELDGETCVYCRIDNKIEQLKSVTSYFTYDSLVYDLDTLLSYTPLKPNICIESFRQHLIERLPMDCILMNVDLHSGNVGFIRGERDSKV